MDESTDTRSDWWQAMFDQHWQHARHAEILRNAMVAVFQVILVGVIALKSELTTASALGLQIFLMTLALIGALVSLKTDYVFQGHTHLADSILKRHGLPMMLVHLRLKHPHPIERYIHVSKLYPLFFFVCFCYLLGISLSGPALLCREAAWSIAFVVFVILVIGLHRLKYQADQWMYEPGTAPEPTNPVVPKPASGQ